MLFTNWLSGGNHRLSILTTGVYFAVGLLLLRGVRLAVSPAYYLSGLHPETERVVRSAIARLKDARAEFLAKFPSLSAEIVDSVH